MRYTEEQCQSHPERPTAGRCKKCNQVICDLCSRINKKKCSTCNKANSFNFGKAFLYLFAAFSIIFVIFKYGISENNNLQLTGQEHTIFDSSKDDIALLGKEPCDRNTILERCNDALLKNNARVCLKLSNAFLRQCGDYDQVHIYRNTAAIQLSEWNIALESANMLIDTHPDSATVWYKRANTYHEKGDVPNAIEDYKKVLALEPREIQSPFHLASLYQRIGKPCEGIQPLSNFIFEHPEIPSNADQLIAHLYQNPTCADLKGTGKASIKINKNGGAIFSQVKINGMLTGKFVVDTGASMVTLTTKFADKLGLPYQKWENKLLYTANGSTNAKIGRLDNVSLQGISAKNVEVAVIENTNNDGTDGLLGLSFLSRFNMKMEANQGYLKLDSKFSKK
jgi:aspartyl protease family protein